MTFSFASDRTDEVTVTTWKPPHRFVAVSTDFIPGGPSVTTEWTVHEGSGGTCTVRVEHRMAADTDEWDTYLEAAASGWPAFFENLKSDLSN